MIQKKTTTINQLLSYINTTIEQISTLPVNNPETQAYLHAMYDVRKKIEEGGQLNMLQDGFLRVLEGITTIEEVERVAGK